MHKGIMLIVAAEDADDAKSKVEEFLGDYGDGKVWDWYVVGGRWSGKLNKLYDKFKAAAKKHFVSVYGKEAVQFLSTKMVEEQAETLKAIWEKMGGAGKNPYARDAYADRTGADDIMPLSECAAIVKKWKRDLVKEANKAFRQLCIERKKEREARKRGETYVNTMSAYYAGIYKDATYDDFCFDSNTYDIDAGTNDPTAALANPEGRWVVMVDLHN